MKAPKGQATVHVVTSFLTRDGKALVLRRSMEVGTYRGKWAGVSGYLEPGEKPLERALVEIREETGFERDMLVLKGLGPELPIRGTDYIVHPFLFEAKEGQVRIDWEHTEYKWVDPSEMARMDTVPQLADALEAAQRSGTKSLTMR